MKDFFVGIRHFSLVSLLFWGVSAWAQSSPQPAQADPSSFIFLMIAMVGIMYFIVIRPQQKEQKQHQQRIAALKKGDRVITAGGIHGVVKTVKEKTLVVEIAPGVKVTLNRQSISTVLEGETGKSKKGGSANEESEEEGEED